MDKLEQQELDLLKQQSRLLKMRKTFRIAEYETEEGYHLFDIFDVEDNDNAIETFMTEEHARDYVFDTYGREAIIQ